MTSDGDSPNLYEFFSVNRNATLEEIKKSYRKLALQYHPDKNPSVDAKATFQTISHYYSILSDTNLRARYDSTGSIDSTPPSTSMDWKEYFDAMWKKISKDDITSFAAKWVGGEEEKREVIEAYEKYKGNMDKILEHVILAEWSDESRFREIIETEIGEGRLERYKAFKADPKATKKRQRKALKEAKEHEKMMQDQDNDLKELQALIKSNAKNKLDAVVASIEGKVTKRGKKRVAEPTDEEFEALQKKLFATKK